MNTNGDQRQKRKLTLPSLQKLLIFDAQDGPLSPKTPKSPKIILSKGSPNRGRLPTCSICTDDLIMFDEEPAGESQLDSSVEKNRTTASDKAVSNQDSSSCLRPILIIKCGHTFHTGCINKWFMENREKDFKTCPICRREMRSNDTRRVFLSFGEE